MRTAKRAALGVILLLASAVQAPAASDDALIVHDGHRRFTLAPDQVALVNVTTVTLIRAGGRSLAELEANAPAGAVPVYHPLGEPPTAAGRRYGTPLVAVRAQARVGKAVADAPGFQIVRASSAFAAPALADRLARSADVEDAWPLLAHLPSLRAVTPDDPLFEHQWHHRNTSQRGGRVDVDANTDEAWETATGAGVRISVVDDGVEHTHEDLAANYVADSSRDVCGSDPDPMPGPLSSHGTAVAGVAAARGDNGVGVAGVAYEAELSGQLLLSCASNDASVATALGAFDQALHISTNSWGPSDNGTTLDGPGPIALAAIADNIANGRGGLGTIYTWANGNGRRNGDDGNYDGYTNLPWMISVGAVGLDGMTASYAETCACMLVTAPSDSGRHSSSTFATLGLEVGGSGITTTDRTAPAPFYAALSNYTHGFGGTSAATPLVAGVVALMLEVQPSLSWRDVQVILALTARTDVLSDTTWQTNGAGRLVSHDFGFGLVDAAAAVALASSWTPLPPQRSITATEDGSFPVPDGIEGFPTPGDPAEITFVIEDDVVVERVSLTFGARLQRRGELRLELISPSGTTSVLWPGRMYDTAEDLGPYDRWTVTSVLPMGESSVGPWRLLATDLRRTSASSLHDLTLTITGH